MELFQHCVTPWSLLINFFSNHGCEAIYQAGLPVDPLSLAEYLPYFLKTFILELPIYFIFLTRMHSFFRIVMINLVLNLLTHPLIFLGMPVMFEKFGFTYLQYLLIAEIFAPLAEGIFLNYAFKVEGRTAFRAAVMANLFS